MKVEDKFISFIKDLNPMPPDINIKVFREFMGIEENAMFSPYYLIPIFGVKSKSR